MCVRASLRFSSASIEADELRSHTEGGRCCQLIVATSVTGVVQQVMVHACHEYTCMPVAHLSAPARCARRGRRVLAERRLPAIARRRCLLRWWRYSVEEEQPCVLERFVALLDITERPQQPPQQQPNQPPQAAQAGTAAGAPAPASGVQQQFSILVQTPSASPPTPRSLFGLTVAHQWAMAVKALPLVLPPELDQLLVAINPPEGADRRAVVEAGTTLSLMACCPYVQVTVLSAEVPALLCAADGRRRRCPAECDRR